MISHAWSVPIDCLSDSKLMVMLPFVPYHPVSISRFSLTKPGDKILNEAAISSIQPPLDRYPLSKEAKEGDFYEDQFRLGNANSLRSAARYDADRQRALLERPFHRAPVQQLSLTSPTNDPALRSILESCSAPCDYSEPCVFAQLNGVCTDHLIGDCALEFVRSLDGKTCDKLQTIAGNVLDSPARPTANATLPEPLASRTSVRAPATVARLAGYPVAASQRWVMWLARIQLGQEKYPTGADELYVER
ncbi:hypothetical protein HPB49_017072 [Dermacentor silvarum]|uniref:Uncharacterized protein n=1 Tax=Dermacentor silvarum TaxID=543639 RepID=A0ACB8CM54_DERSI|nr:hypothetical protein HPB49_017072 [Dermacentor silvarum]